MTRKFKFRGYHPAYGLFDFGFDRYSFYTTDNSKIPLKIIEIDGYRIIDPASIPPIDKNIITYLRMGMAKDGSFNLVYKPIDDPDLIIMQYLGDDCKDAEGILLCEDDLIVIRTCRFPNDPMRIVYLEEWSMFCPVRNNGQYFDMQELGGWEYFRKIGNIHENPELWK